MGPTILLDKSPFQKCPKSLLPELFRHYSLVVPSILLNEILEDHAESPDKFLALARRLDCIDIGINVDYRGMVEGELLGYTVPMEGRACLAGSAVSTDEGLLHVLKETPEEKALHRWQRGYVSP